MNGTWDSGDEHVFDLFIERGMEAAYVLDKRSVRIRCVLTPKGDWHHVKVYRAQLVGQRHVMNLVALAFFACPSAEKARDAAVAWVAGEVARGTIREHYASRGTT